MSVHFILDGYNVVKQVSEFSEVAIETGRERLIRAIAKRKPQGSVHNQVTVVFDGRPGRNSPPGSTSVRVIFSEGETADDRIKDLVAQSANRRRMIVVTNDREIQYHVKALGGAVWSVKEFMAKMGDAPPERLGSRPVKVILEGKVIAKTVEHAINQEMERVWLEKRKVK